MIVVTILCENYGALLTNDPNSAIGPLGWVRTTSTSSDSERARGGTHPERTRCRRVPVRKHLPGKAGRFCY